MKSKNRLCIKNLAGALAIPVLVAILLQGICMAKGKTMIMNMTSFDNFVVYIAIVMITTIALSINLNSGRYERGTEFIHDCFYRKLALCSNYYCGGIGNYYWTL